MAKKETNTKSFILRIDSETMSAIAAGRWLGGG